MIRNGTISIAELVALRRSAPALSHARVYVNTLRILAGGGPPEDEARFVSRDYLATLGTRIVAGRGFGPDDGRRQPRTIVINQTLARRHFPDWDPFGEYAYLRGATVPWLIVGVVEDVRQSGPDRLPGEQVFVDIGQ